MAYITRASRIAAIHRNWTCPNGCGHPSADHHENRETDPAFEPLRFLCAACECVNKATVR